MKKGVDLYTVVFRIFFVIHKSSKAEHFAINSFISIAKMYCLRTVRDTRVVVLGDGEAYYELESQSDCSGRPADFDYPSESHYFADTSLYERYLVDIQEYLGCPDYPGPYDAWFELDNTTRIAGLAVYNTLWWAPYNGRLLYDEVADEWVVINFDDDTRLMQVGGSRLSHPDWISSWQEYNFTDTNYTGYITVFPAIQIQCGDPPVITRQPST